MYNISSNKINFFLLSLTKISNFHDISLQYIDYPSMHQLFISKSSKSSRGKTVLDEEKRLEIGACCVGLGEAFERPRFRATSDESRILSPSARHFSPGIAARFYSSLLCLLVPPAHPPRSIPHLTEYTRTQVHTHYYCASVRFHLPMKNLPSKKNERSNFSPPPFLIQLVL